MKKTAGSQVASILKYYIVTVIVFSETEASLMNCCLALFWQLGKFAPNKPPAVHQSWCQYCGQRLDCFEGNLSYISLLWKMLQCKKRCRICPCSVSETESDAWMSVSHFNSVMWHFSKWNRIFDEKKFFWTLISQVDCTTIIANSNIEKSVHILVNWFVHPNLIMHFFTSATQTSKITHWTELVQQPHSLPQQKRNDLNVNVDDNPKSSLNSKLKQQLAWVHKTSQYCLIQSHHFHYNLLILKH